MVVKILRAQNYKKMRIGAGSGDFLLKKFSHAEYFAYLCRLMIDSYL